MDIKHVIHDNYLNEVDYKNLTTIMMKDKFPWLFKDTVASHLDKDNLHFYWSHSFFTQASGISSPFFNILLPILNKLKVKALIRIKANLYSNQGKIVEHEKHIDFNFEHKGALFSLNTCNGFTTLKDGTKIQSVGNRMLCFDPSISHHSSTCTDTNVRVNINFNYF